MAKITLGKRPQFIETTISAPLPDGTVGSIKVKYKYRTRTEFGEMIDKRIAEARTEPPAEPADFSVATMQRQARDANAAYLLDILDGWDLSDEVNLETATQLCDEFPGMAQAVIDGYRLAATEGRLGN
jgi:hypothetical protein